MKLEEILSKTKSGTYVAVVPTPEIELKLQRWASENNLVLEKDLHVTLLYSRKVLDVKPTTKVYHGAPAGITPLGDADMVLKLASSELVDRHNELIKLGGTHDFPSYIPHMTLVKDAGRAPRPPLPDFEIVLHQEYVEPLTLDE